MSVTEENKAGQGSESTWWGAFIGRMAREGIPEKNSFQQKKVQEGDLRIISGRSVQGKGEASAKALRQGCVWHV